MARALQKSVTLVASFSDTSGDPVTPEMLLVAAKATGHTIYVEDHEELPTTVEKLEILLSEDVDEDPIVAEKAAETEDGGLTELNQTIALLDALVADKGAEAKNWKTKRMTFKEEAPE